MKLLKGIGNIFKNLFFAMVEARQMRAQMIIERHKSGHYMWSE